MIVSDQHQFVFIHIPKCGGTFVREKLDSFDSRCGRFSGRVENHGAIGQLDYVHIPLFVLREHFAEEFVAITDYWSLAIMRDPFSRFASSISQRLRKYSDLPIQKRSLSDVRAVIGQCIDYLYNRPQSQDLLPPEYIHFQKQIDYIELDGKRIPDALYTVEEIDILLSDLGRRIGENLLGAGIQQGARPANRTVVFRSDLLRRVIETPRPVTDRLGRVLPEKTKQTIRDKVYVPRDQQMKVPFGAPEVREFIQDYYSDDIALYKELSLRRRSNSV
jgi:hypothetical protein